MTRGELGRILGKLGPSGFLLFDVYKFPKAIVLAGEHEYYLAEFYAGTIMLGVQGSIDQHDHGKKGQIRPSKRSISRGDGSPQTPCHIMADVAQNEANDAMMQHRDNKWAAIKQFDKTFSTLYVGGPATNSYEAYRWRGGDGRTINFRFPFTGGDGFRPEYKDSGSNADPLIAGPRADQTHHFAAYFSLGINAVVLATAYGVRKEDNEGDLRLSKSAYRLGTRLRERSIGLNNIGRMIKMMICEPRGHGLYK